MSFVCVDCGSDKFAHHGISWKCVVCGRYYYGKELFGASDIVTDDDFDIVERRRLQMSGRGMVASDLLDEYRRRQNHERLVGRNSRDKEKQDDRKNMLRSLELCITCGKNPIHKGGQCIACRERKKESYQRCKAMRQKKMTEKIESKEALKVGFIRSMKANIPNKDIRETSVFLQQAVAELSLMAMGDVLKIPIGDSVAEPNLKITKNRYVYACREAAKRVNGSFRIYERGKDVYVEKLE